MDRKQLIMSFVTLAACVAGLAACGGGGSENPSAGLSKAEFVRKADAICEKTDKVQTAAIAKTAKELSGSLSSPANQEKILYSAGLPPVKQEAEELAQIGAPKGEEKEVAALVEAIEAAIAEVEKGTQKLESAFAKPSEIGAKFGFKACAEPL